MYSSTSFSVFQSSLNRIPEIALNQQKMIQFHYFHRFHVEKVMAYEYLPTFLVLVIQIQAYNLDADLIFSSKSWFIYAIDILRTTIGYNAIIYIKNEIK